MSLQEEELVSSHAGQPEQASSLLDQIMAQTRIQPGSEGYDVARQGVTAFIASILQSTASAEPVNKLAVDSMIADIDERISRQMDVIIHAPAFQQVESFWRSLKTMVDRVDFRENIKVNVLHVTKQELLEDFEFAPEIIQSGFYKHVYSSGFGQFGGEPIAAVLGAYEFKNTAPDMKLLQYVSAVGAMAHAPFLSSVSPEFMGLNSWTELTNIKDLYAIFEGPAYTKWRALRDSEDSRYLGLTVERLAAQIEPVYLPERKIHLYHCDHRGLPLALISEDGNTAWSAEYDEWGNQLNEENPHHLHQPYRLPGQQYDKESGLYYNRHRYYDPLQGRYITPDPIGLRGGWNMYQYPLNPIQVIDPMGLDAIENMTSGGLIYAVSGVPGLIAANSITNSAYQFGYDMDAIVGGAHNGAADAMRHCYLMCRMTKTFGSTIADVIGKNHEAAGDRQGQPAKERIMDLKNNTVGIACGDFSAKCSDACIEKYNTGQLFGLDGIKADNPIKAKQGSSDASNY
ncbi:TPA: type VI secretion system contractile sheath large subunit [Escherichia coli]|nr:type VI secretion system contractile sheath large subunit [Escherichia coli]HAP1314588.1 type VI secretion system contractile sheath large subunit [Escherichia coli]HBE5604198.1 type VI secretion system contractile sheath large subunit [Escherichia coli]HCP7705043.1 type VI secretion system contractile sheath large subunit [Escherichia coli]HDP8306948.1 type VI secretion system contractile sheath large subunit [Escherichia coli]